MRLGLVAVAAVLLAVVGQCGNDADVAPPAGPTAAAPSTTRQEGGETSARAVLGRLPVKGRAPMTGYDRDRFGQAWLDADRNGCDTRNDVLREQLRSTTVEGNGCVVAAGVYDDPYTGARIDYRQGDGTLLDIDHLVALGNAWATGAFRWEVERRAAFANDPLNLLPADAGANRQKGDGDAATWLPPNKPFRCAYVSRQVAVKAKYDLWVTAPEQAAMERVLVSCGDPAIAADPWGAPTEVDHAISDPVRYDDCDAVRAAGVAPVHAGDPGYGTHLDRDGDGTACE